MDDKLICGVDNSAVSVDKEKDCITITVHSMGMQGQSFVMIARLDKKAVNELLEVLREINQ